MTAGLNCAVDIWRMDNAPDDTVGGAMITGTVVYSHIETRFQGHVPNQLLLQQGLETQRTFSAIVHPGTLDIRERDEMQIVAPVDHVYYLDRFRIVGVTFSNFNSRSNNHYMMLSLVRSVRAHGNQ